MNVLVIQGSARKQGNSSFLATQLAEAIRGAEIIHRHLYDLTFKGCQGCMACRKTLDHCIIEDDLTPVLGEMNAADIVIFATPNYNGGMTGEMKCLIDRCFSFLRTDHFAMRSLGIELAETRLPRGKTAVALFVQGQGESGQPEAFVQFAHRVKYLGFTYIENFKVCGLNSSKDSRNRPDLLDKVRALGGILTERYAS